MKYGAAYKGALQLQRLIIDNAPDAANKDLANMAASFVRLEMLKLRLRMKPAPKPIDVSVKKKNEAPNVTLE